jgi:hypothetical protein
MRSRLPGRLPAIGSWSPSGSTGGFAAHPLLVGSVAGIIAVLRVDPTEASMTFRRRHLGDAGWTVTFGAAYGLLTYWVLEPERILVLLDLTWAG